MWAFFLRTHTQCTLTFPACLLYLHLSINPTKSETKTLTAFGIKPARQKSQALQVAPVQRTDAGVF